MEDKIISVLLEKDCLDWVCGIGPLLLTVITVLITFR